MYEFEWHPDKRSQYLSNLDAQKKGLDYQTDSLDTQIDCKDRVGSRMSGQSYNVLTTKLTAKTPGRLPIR